MTKLSTTNECTSVQPILMLEMMRRHDTADTTRWRGFRASLEATGRLHWVSIQLYCPGWTAGLHTKKNDEKAPYLPAIFLALAVCRYDTECSPDGRGPGLLQKPLVTVIGRVLWPIYEIGHAYGGFFRVFSLLIC